MLRVGKRCVQVQLLAYYLLQSSTQVIHPYIALSSVLIMHDPPQGRDVEVARDYGGKHLDAGLPPLLQDCQDWIGSRCSWHDLYTHKKGAGDTCLMEMVKTSGAAQRLYGDLAGSLGGRVQQAPGVY